MTKKTEERMKKEENDDRRRYETVPEDKWMEFKDMIDRYFDHPEQLDRFDNDSKILVLDEIQIVKILTRERLRILKKIKEKKIENLNELAEALGRDPSAVNRDINILEDFRILHRDRVGKNVIPVLDTEVILLPISRINLFDLLKGREKGDTSLRLPFEEFEMILLMDVILREIILKLDDIQVDYNKLIEILTPWIQQELHEIPERMAKRLRTIITTIE